MSCTVCESQSTILSFPFEISIQEDIMKIKHSNIDDYNNFNKNNLNVQISYCPFCSEELKQVTPPASNE